MSSQDRSQERRIWGRGMAGRVQALAVAALVGALWLGGAPAQAQQCVAQFQNTAQEAWNKIGIWAKGDPMMESEPSLVMLYQEMEKKSPYEWQTTYYKVQGRADPSYTWK